MLPTQYQWLEQEPSPKMLLEFLKMYGVTEAPGTGDNPTILAWAKETGLEKVYIHDSIAWCGLAAAVAAQRAGKEVPKDPLWALNWAKFGTHTNVPMLGDILVFTRTGGGHVGLYVGEDDTAYHVLGGNTSDKVTIARIAKARLYTARRPIYSIAQPTNVRRIILSSNGELSTNEK